MFNRFQRFLKHLGPGFVTGASDDDPSGIATYAQAGAGFGFSTLWTILFTVPLMIAVQEMSARIALVTRRGLMHHIRNRYHRTLVIGVAFLLFLANTINIGADLGMMASAAQSFVPVSFAGLLIFMALITLVLEIFTSYKTYARYLKWLTISLFAYVVTAFFIHAPWKEVIASTFIPRIQFNSDYLLILVALLGTTISPYLYFWQANQEIEEEREHHYPKVSTSLLRRMLGDVSFGMIFSNVIAWFIIVATAVALFSHGYTEIASVDQAAHALAPFAGSFAAALFSLGIIGTGLLTIPILSGTAAYACSELFGVREGLSQKWWRAKTFYGVIIVSVVLGAGMNALGIPPFRALVYSAIVNALIAPPLLFMILRIGSDKQVMGEHVSHSWSRLGGWLTFVVMT
ncbi:divalent metal cation transporter, partial [Candidatus Uhrbacteria bacterium]|nr:divalent metal cation transporter [Candidatus Uhrbacteria bacterium]